MDGYECGASRSSESEGCHSFDIIESLYDIHNLVLPLFKFPMQLSEHQSATETKYYNY